MGKQDRHYEELYMRLRERAEDMHSNNKKRIRTGLIVLGLIPVVLILMRLLTDSDRVVFLIIWILCTFAVCIYLITIEYIDDSLEKTLEEVTERETDFDELLIGTEQLGELILERRERRHERREAKQENKDS